MALEALTHDDAGRLVLPDTMDEWDQWVSAGRTRNYCNHDPLLDWLDRHGEDAGFERDVTVPETDFLEFIFGRGHAFEAAVLRHLETLVPITRIVPKQENASEDIRSVEFAERTFEAMQAGAEVIAQGAIRDPQHRIYGAPDLLVRSDILNRLFPGTLPPDDASIVAPDLAGPFHYRVVDIKFTSLKLDAKGHIESGKLPYMAQVYLYNRALGRLQGYEPGTSYILGRGWSQKNDRGDSCMDRLAPVEQDYQAPRADIHLPTVATRAVEWVRAVRREGAGWSASPEPVRHELRPNMANTQDQPWHAAKKRIAEETGELTSLWQVGVEKRNKALALGPLRSTDPECCAERVGLGGGKLAPTLDKILAINRSTDGPHVQPARINAKSDIWRPREHAYFVDFEWVSNLDDDFSRIPKQNGNPLIFMIGCGHVENGEWVFEEFTVDRLTADAERRIVDDWMAHMAATTARLAPGTEPLVFHWSPAEESALTTQYRSARSRHPDAGWPEPRWFDFLKEVMKDEPVIVRGAMGFGLKAIANAFYRHGLIATSWKDGPTDGLGAMVGAWTCNRLAAERDCSMRELPLMREIADYNHVDCRVMYDIVEYLRDHH